MVTEKKESKKKSLVEKTTGRFDVVRFVKEWIILSKKLDSNKGLSQSELVRKAVSEVMDGKLSEDDIARVRTAYKDTREAEKEESLKAS